MGDPERMLLFALADHLGKTVNELETQMSRAELIEWNAYFRIKARERGR